MRYVNTALASSMLPDGHLSIVTLPADAARAWLLSGPRHNACNPSHSNTLVACEQHLGVGLSDARGGRITLATGDSCLVLQVSGLPRETREFSDAEIASAVFGFRLVTVTSSEQVVSENSQ